MKFHVHAWAKPTIVKHGKSNNTKALTERLSVLVCGLPGSGNALVREHCLRSGATTMLDHANDPKTWIEAEQAADVLLIPIRLDEISRQQSALRRAGGFSVDLDKITMIKHRIYKSSKPKYCVLFEEILRTKGKALDDVLILMGLTPVAWPEKKSSGVLESGAVLSDTERQAHNFAQGFSTS